MSNPGLLIASNWRSPRIRSLIVITMLLSLMQMQNEFWRAWWNFSYKLMKRQKNRCLSGWKQKQKQLNKKTRLLKDRDNLFCADPRIGVLYQQLLSSLLFPARSNVSRLEVEVVLQNELQAASDQAFAELSWRFTLHSQQTKELYVTSWEIRLHRNSKRRQSCGTSPSVLDKLKKLLATPILRRRWLFIVIFIQSFKNDRNTGACSCLIIAFTLLQKQKLKILIFN